jgi:hypothetical protein
MERGEESEDDDGAMMSEKASIWEVCFAFSKLSSLVILAVSSSLEIDIAVSF